MTKRRSAKRKAYPEIPPGPRNCLRVNLNSQTCQACGTIPLVLHTPLRAAGRFCRDCCPSCSAS